MVRWLTVSSASLMLLFAAAPAHAQGAEPAFGDQGQFILSADRVMGLFDYTSFKESRTVAGQTGSSSDNYTSLALLENPLGSPLIAPSNVPRISFDYTVIPHLTIGGSVVVAFTPGASHNDCAGGQCTSTDSPTTTLFGIAPRVGYILGLTPLFSFWPRGGFSFYSLSSKTSNGGAMTSSSDTYTQFQINLEPMFVLTPVPHFGIVGGPVVDIPITGKHSVDQTMGGTTNSTSTDLTLFHFGIQIGLLGWI